MSAMFGLQAFCIRVHLAVLISPPSLGVPVLIFYKVTVHAGTKYYNASGIARLKTPFVCVCVRLNDESQMRVKRAVGFFRPHFK